MSEVQYSEDGQWWWDEAGQQWQPVAAAADYSHADEASAEQPADSDSSGPLASLSEEEIASYFHQALDAGVSEVYEA